MQSVMDCSLPSTFAQSPSRNTHYTSARALYIAIEFSFVCNPVLLIKSAINNFLRGGEISADTPLFPSVAESLGNQRRIETSEFGPRPPQKIDKKVTNFVTLLTSAYYFFSCVR